jgi:hypothetical protein
MEIFVLLMLTLLIGFPISRVFGLKIKYTGPVGDMRGTLNGMTYSVWKAGVYVAKKVASVIANPQSAKQAKMRCNIASCSAAWRLLDAAAKSAWDAFAATEPGKGDGDGGIYNLIKGNGGKMTGWNAFLFCNQLLESANLAAVTAPPLGEPSPGAPTTVVASQVGNAIHVTWVDPVGAIAGDKVRIFITGRNGLIHKQLTRIVAIAVQQEDIVSFQGAGGVTVATSDYPGDYLVQLDCITQTGVKSGPSMTATVTVV